MFFHFFNLDKFSTVLLILLQILIILLLLGLNTFKTNILDFLVVFKIKINSIAIF